MDTVKAEQHLLLVDDEENVLRSLQRLLRREGYCLHFANSARKAFEVLAEHPIDVILSDHRMPEQTGTEFLSQVKDLYPKTVRLMLSGYTEVQSVSDAINEGAIYKFLTKPWDDGQLRANVREAFQRHAIEAENERLHQQVEEMNAELLMLNHALEQKLQESNLRIDRNCSLMGVMQEMIDHLPLGVIGVDSAGEVVSINEWGAWLIGAPASSYIGRSCNDLLDPLPTLIHDYLFGDRPQTLTTKSTINEIAVQITIKPMGLRSTSSGCLVILEKLGAQP